MHCENIQKNSDKLCDNSHGRFLFLYGGSPQWSTAISTNTLIAIIYLKRKIIGISLYPFILKNKLWI